MRWERAFTVLRHFSEDFQEHFFKKAPILESIIETCSSKQVFCKYAAKIWKSIFGGVRFWNTECSSWDSQKTAPYLQNKNTYGDCLHYLKEHLWLGQCFHTDKPS